VELIMADHRRIRRLSEALRDAARGNGNSGPAWTTDVWHRLTELLATHFEAEEEISYLPMFKVCPHPAKRRQDALADHDDIREAVDEASLHAVGSAQWWRSVRAALTATAEHIDREENELLAECLPKLTRSQRRILGRQWLAFIAARARDSRNETSRNARWTSASGEACP
jgi:hypothetical protein